MIADDDPFGDLDENSRGRTMDDGLDDVFAAADAGGIDYDLGLDTGDPLAGLDNNRYGYKEEEEK